MESLLPDQKQYFQSKDQILVALIRFESYIQSISFHPLKQCEIFIPNNM